MEEMTLEEFKEKIMKGSENVYKNDEGLAEAFKELDEYFKIVFICRKCKSSRVEIIGETGVDYGELTGYSPGSNVIKCLDCGNAWSYYL